MVRHTPPEREQDFMGIWGFGFCRYKNLDFVRHRYRQRKIQTGQVRAGLPYVSALGQVLENA